MVPNNDIGGLAEPDSLGVRRHSHLHHQRVRAHLRALGLEVVFGQPERLEPELLGENSLAHLVDQRLLCRLVNLRQRALIERHAVLGGGDRQAGCSVVKQADFQHRYFLPGAASRADGPRLARRRTGSLLPIRTAAEVFLLYPTSRFLR